jgi:asparagine synthase (glutamine-hydrolysing)
MCGIAGFIARERKDSSLELLTSMTNALQHRGPDGEGQWLDDLGLVGLGHRRLSIIDLSENASQPMRVRDRYVIVFNGEIYNYIELKALLTKKGCQFHTDSDTEVLVAMYEEFGERCLQFLDGMFAFVIYDRKDRKIFGARDRFGEKPLFYFIDSSGTFYFASEIKALWAIGAPKQMREEFLFNFLAFGSVLNPDDQQQTFYKQIFKIPASNYFSYNESDGSIKFERYWDIDLKRRQYLSDQEAGEELKGLLTTSVKRRLRSDVPVGSSLSGGLDSSIIVSLVDRIEADSDIKQKTFSASFPGFEKDETYFQELVVRQTKAEPHFIYPDESTLLSNLSKIIYHQDEPFGSASINIQYEVFRRAKEEGVTVLLDGQGADEVFAGYHTCYYPYFEELRKKGRKEAAEQYQLYQELHSANKINEKINSSVVGTARDWIPSTVKKYLKRNYVNLPKAKQLFSSDFYNEYKSSLFSIKEHFGSLNEYLYYSIFNYGLEELLRYADRNSMAHSREVRLPFLSHELVEFVFSLPSHLKIRKGWTKWVLRLASDGLTDDQVIWRKDKIGYAPPQQQWLENKRLHEMVMDNENLLVRKGILNKQVAHAQLAYANPWFMLVAGELMQ